MPIKWKATDVDLVLGQLLQTNNANEWRDTLVRLHKRIKRGKVPQVIENCAWDHCTGVATYEPTADRQARTGLHITWGEDRVLEWVYLTHSTEAIQRRGGGHHTIAHAATVTNREVLDARLCEWWEWRLKRDTGFMVLRTKHPRRKPYPNIQKAT